MENLVNLGMYCQGEHAYTSEQFERGVRRHSRQFALNSSQPCMYGGSESIPMKSGSPPIRRRRHKGVPSRGVEVRRY